MGLKIASLTTYGVRCGIATYSHALNSALADLGVEIYVVRIPRFGGKTKGLMEQVARKVPVDEVDLLHIQHEYGILKELEKYFYPLLKRLYPETPVVTTAHAVGNYEIDPTIAKFSDVVVVHNKFCRRKFGFPQKSVIIPHGCSPAETPPMGECKERWGIPTDYPVVGYLGFISSYKRLELLIEAMAKVDAILLICGGWHVKGGTEYATKLQEWSRKVLPHRVKWTGYVEDEDLPYAYGAQDVFCYPTRFCTESGALLTAMSYGRACIASMLPPMNEKEREGAIRVFSDVENLAKQINYLLEHEDSRRKLGRAALEYAKEHSWPKVAQEHLDVYRRLA